MLIEGKPNIEGIYDVLNIHLDSGQGHPAQAVKKFAGVRAKNFCRVQYCSCNFLGLVDLLGTSALGERKRRQGEGKERKK